MCPGAINRQLPRPVYQDWLDTSLCIRSTIFQNRENLLFTCAFCTPPQYTLHRIIVRHYVSIGGAATFETCSECGTDNSITRPAHGCDLCRNSITSFADYLENSGDTPYNDLQPTVLSIVHYTST